MNKKLRYFLIFATSIVVILMFLLALASENAKLFETYYQTILSVNIFFGINLFLLVIFLLVRLYNRYKRKRFGTKLMSKLVIMFTVMGILPGILIYLVSVQFVSRSIESWFNVQVETALESGLSLSRSALNSSLNDLKLKVRSVARELSEMSDNSLATELPKILERNQLQDALIISGNGQLIASTGSNFTSLVSDFPTPFMISRASTFNGYEAIEGFDKNIKNKLISQFEQSNVLRLRVVVSIRGDPSLFSLRSQSRFLQVFQPAPEELGLIAEELRLAYGEYQERSLARSGLQKFYLVTLTLILLLVAFSAMVCAFILASDLTKPLLVLDEGTKAVAEGDLSPKPIPTSSDELGTLTKSFNTMTLQLSEARKSILKNRKALEDAKTYLESVLANMSAGVIVLDSQLKLFTYNNSAERILKRLLKEFLKKSFSEIPGLKSFTNPIIKAFSEKNAQSASKIGSIKNPHWKHQIEIDRLVIDPKKDDEITILMRGTRLKVGSNLGYLIVFDDISDLISGQRSIAWAEVGRRLAHEIKNPLTPIQLSAERLQMKLQNKLNYSDSILLQQGINTIVNQVVAMQQMVDNFRDYAKTPPPKMEVLDLNELIFEILQLYDNNEGLINIITNCNSDLPKILGDTTQLRQVIHNLLQNAQFSAIEFKKEDLYPCINISTESIHFSDPDGKTRTAVSLNISDNGPGFDEKVIKRAFEPYVTTKKKGTGLGLPVVKKIIEEHGGKIEIQNLENQNGARVLILFLKLK